MGYGRPHPGRALRRRLFMRGRTLVFLALIALLGVAAFWIDFGFGRPPKIDFGGYTNDVPVHQGLDLQGGLQIVLEATCPTDKPKCDINASMPAVIDNINRRIAGGLAVNDAVVRQQSGSNGSNRVLIELPGLKDTTQAEALLGSTGQMYIIDTGSASLSPPPKSPTLHPTPAPTPHNIRLPRPGPHHPLK